MNISLNLVSAEQELLRNLGKISVVDNKMQKWSVITKVQLPTSADITHTNTEKCDGTQGPTISGVLVKRTWMLTGL